MVSFCEEIGSEKEFIGGQNKFKVWWQNGRDRDELKENYDFNITVFVQNLLVK